MVEVDQGRVGQGRDRKGQGRGRVKAGTGQDRGWGMVGMGGWALARTWAVHSIAVG